MEKRAARLAFVDTETTGLDPDVHEIWEVGLIVREVDGSEHEHRWFLPVDLGRADPQSLEIGHFYERHNAEAAPGDLHGWPPAAFARDFAKQTRGAHLVGAVVSFDEERLRRLLRANGACPAWHYHLIDVEVLVVGYLQSRAALQWGEGSEWGPPWGSEELSQAIGVPIPSKEERHTALGDARWAKRLYDAVMH